MNTATTAQRQPELAGQTVVVIGGSAGIGLETARRARAEGRRRRPYRPRSRPPAARGGASVGARRTAAFDATDSGRSRAVLRTTCRHRSTT